jgi:peptidoglycan hydrolase-like protein with peptidoglycan-binding domain
MLGASAATIVIVVNAVFLQSGPRPAPFFNNPAPLTVTATTRPRPAQQVMPKPMPQAIPVRSNDPIAELIGPSPRILAVQRVLSEFGYGQITPSGILDDTTSAAIGRFEREHKLPVTGRVSDRLVSDLAAMTGRPME